MRKFSTRKREELKVEENKFQVACLGKRAKLEQTWLDDLPSGMRKMKKLFALEVKFCKKKKERKEKRKTSIKRVTEQAFEKCCRMKSIEISLI